MFWDRKGNFFLWGESLETNGSCDRPASWRSEVRAEGIKLATPRCQVSPEDVRRSTFPSVRLESLYLKPNSTSDSWSWFRLFTTCLVSFKFIIIHYYSISLFFSRRRLGVPAGALVPRSSFQRLTGKEKELGLFSHCYVLKNTFFLHI